jgi:3-methyl-2-oxobutanoate hydroxymethyltransferase
VQGRDAAGAATLLEQARALEAAGAAMLVIELVPTALGAQITQALTIPVIGIGAGPDCSGQVLVTHDMLGLGPDKPARFVRNFMDKAVSVSDAVRAYVQAVKTGHFPEVPTHTY